MTKLFVYGTLMQGQPNHGLLCACAPCLDHGPSFGPTCACEICAALGSACTSTLITTGYIEGSLLDLGPFPMAVENPGHWIAGEVYEVDEAVLWVVDKLEHYHGPGNPENMYDRRSVLLWLYHSQPADVVPQYEVDAYFGAGISLLQDWHDAGL